MTDHHVVSRRKPSKLGLSDPNSEHRKHLGSVRWWRSVREMVERIDAEARAEQRALTRVGWGWWPGPCGEVYRAQAL